jgi:hypothetical protein
MPASVRDVMRAAYGDATAEIFLISAVIGIVALVAILFIKEQPLRRTVDIEPEAAAPAPASPARAGTGAEGRARVSAVPGAAEAVGRPAPRA